MQGRELKPLQRGAPAESGESGPRVFSETAQVIHVKKLPEARKITTEKVEGPAYGTHTGPETVLVPQAREANLIIHEYSEEVWVFFLQSWKSALD